MTVVRAARVLAVTATLVVLWSITGCTPNTNNTKDQPLPTKRQADVVAMLKNYGLATATVVGAPLENWADVPAPCEGRNGELATDGRFDITGNANITVPANQHIATLRSCATTGYNRATRSPSSAPSHPTTKPALSPPATPLTASLSPWKAPNPRKPLPCSSPPPATCPPQANTPPASDPLPSMPNPRSSRSGGSRCRDGGI